MATPTDDLVQPKQSALPAAESKTPDSGGIPDEVLQIPALQALFSGSPAALSASLATFANRPEGKLIQKNISQLERAGMGRYRGLDGDTGVIFNQAYLSGEEIQAADKAGQLSQIAPAFYAVNSQVAQSGENNPVLNAQPPSGFKTAPVPSAPQSNSPVPPASANTQRQAMAARVMNMKPSSPTSGPKPGAGRLLASILKPVV